MVRDARYNQQRVALVYESNDPQRVIDQKTAIDFVDLCHTAYRWFNSKQPMVITGQVSPTFEVRSRSNPHGSRAFLHLGTFDSLQPPTEKPMWLGTIGALCHRMSESADKPGSFLLGSANVSTVTMFRGRSKVLGFVQWGLKSTQS